MRTQSKTRGYNPTKHKVVVDSSFRGFVHGASNHKQKSTHQSSNQNITKQNNERSNNIEQRIEITFLKKQREGQPPAPAPPP
jgi:hypothetical protein